MESDNNDLARPWGLGSSQNVGSGQAHPGTVDVRDRVLAVRDRSICDDAGVENGAMVEDLALVKDPKRILDGAMVADRVLIRPVLDESALLCGLPSTRDDTTSGTAWHGLANGYGQAKNGVGQEPSIAVSAVKEAIAMPIVETGHAMPAMMKESVGVGSAKKPKRQLPVTWPRVELSGIPTDLLEMDDAVDLIIDHALNAPGSTLGVVSMNLDHVHHFGSGRTSARLERRQIIDLSVDDNVNWLTLLDGAPLVKKAGELTGHPWPRLAGSDLIEHILDRANEHRLSVGFLGGAAETHKILEPLLARRWRAIRVGGLWSPARADLDDPEKLSELSESIRSADVDILVVCLGKPRQERWIAEHGHESGARVCLAFGAVVDFLAERVERSPRWIADNGLEWAWRLANEPRRLARRYLIQGPPAYRRLQRDSFVKVSTSYPARTMRPVPDWSSGEGTFVGTGAHADVAVIVVTGNSADDVDALVESVRRQTVDQSIRLIVVDNSSADDTSVRVLAHGDVLLVKPSSDLGYAGGINAAGELLGPCDAVLILNSGLELAPGSLQALRSRLMHDQVQVAVPRLLDVNGETYASIRREPSLSRALGDALLGERLAGRPSWLSETELDPRLYRYAHPIDWATGAALLIDFAAYQRVGKWDERFFLYSEETDFLRRIREGGGQVWFESAAIMQHRRAVSGGSPEMDALMEVNRVRYHEKLHGRLQTVPMHLAVTLRSALRYRQAGHRRALDYLLRRSRWTELPGARQDGSGDD